MKVLKLCQIALAAIAMLAIAGQTQAGSVYNLSTGTADWQIIAKPAADPNPLGTAVVINPHSAWNSSLVDADTKWIGIASNNASQGYAGDYVYLLEMDLDNPGDYVVSGAFTQDNLMKSLKINGVEMLAAPQSNIRSFQHIFNFNGGSGSQTVEIEAVVWNAVHPGSPDPGNPTGFILGGEVQIVPLPAAAWAGISMLGGMGLIRKLRRS